MNSICLYVPFYKSKTLVTSALTMAYSECIVNSCCFPVFLICPLNTIVSCFCCLKLHTLRFSNYVVSLTRAFIHTIECMTALVLSLLPSNHSILMRGDVGQSVASAEARAMWNMNFCCSDWNFKGLLIRLMLGARD